MTLTTDQMRVHACDVDVVGSYLWGTRFRDHNYARCGQSVLPTVVK